MIGLGLSFRLPVAASRQPALVQVDSDRSKLRVEPTMTNQDSLPSISRRAREGRPCCDRRRRKQRPAPPPGRTIGSTRSCSTQWLVKSAHGAGDLRWIRPVEKRNASCRSCEWCVVLSPRGHQRAEEGRRVHVGTYRGQVRDRPWRRSIRWAAAARPRLRFGPGVRQSSCSPRPTCRIATSPTIWLVGS